MNTGAGRLWGCALLLVAASLLAPRGAWASEYDKMVITAAPAAVSGAGSVQVVIRDDDLLTSLAQPGPDRFRVAIGDGRARVTGVQNVADQGQDAYTVLAFDQSGNLVKAFAVPRYQYQTQLRMLTAKFLPCPQCQLFLRCLSAAGNHHDFAVRDVEQASQFARAGIRAFTQGTVKLDRAGHMRDLRSCSQLYQSIGILLRLRGDQ